MATAKQKRAASDGAGAFIVETEPAVEERQGLGKWLWSAVVLVVVLVAVTLIVLPIYVLTSGRYLTADSQAAVIGAAASWFAASLTAIAAFVALLAYKSGERRPSLRLELRENASGSGLDIWLRNQGYASAHKPILICELEAYVYKDVKFERWYRVEFHPEDQPDGRVWTRMVWVRDISIHPGISQGVESLPAGAVQDPLSGLELPEAREVPARFKWTCDGAVLTTQSVKLRFGPGPTAIP